MKTIQIIRERVDKVVMIAGRQPGSRFLHPIPAEANNIHVPTSTQVKHGGKNIEKKPQAKIGFRKYY